MADRGIDWRYSPLTGSHYGRLWERLIGSCKAALHAILETRSVNDEVLRTVFAEVSSLLNSQPPTHVSADQKAPEPLTPNNFMLGGPQRPSSRTRPRRSILRVNEVSLERGPVYRRPILAAMDERVPSQSHRRKCL